MKNFSFNHIYYRGKIVFENDLFLHYHTAEMLLLYDGNFLQFKRMPTIEECQSAIHYLKEYHANKGQDHVKLLFPENEPISEEINSYLQETGFQMGFMEMYAIKPDQFPNVPNHDAISVVKATNANWETFLSLKHEIDAAISVRFAEAKRVLHEQNYKDDGFMQFMAFYEGTPAGAVDVIIKEHTAEIDNLVILDDYQKKGIGSQLQKAVMDEFPDKTVILIADGEDTPREMYQKQNYQHIGTKYEALKVYEN